MRFEFHFRRETCLPPVLFVFDGERALTFQSYRGNIHFSRLLPSYITAELPTLETFEQLSFERSPCFIIRSRLLPPPQLLLVPLPSVISADLSHVPAIHCNIHGRQLLLAIKLVGKIVESWIFES